MRRNAFLLSWTFSTVATSLSPRERRRSCSSCSRSRRADAAASMSPLPHGGDEVAPVGHPHQCLPGLRRLLRAQGCTRHLSERGASAHEDAGGAQVGALIRRASAHEGDARCCGGLSQIRGRHRAGACTSWDGQYTSAVRGVRAPRARSGFGLVAGPRTRARCPRTEFGVQPPAGTR